MTPDAASRFQHGTDRNLLFGILALQLDFIGRDALIDALRDWTTRKDQPLGQILVERGDLPASRRDLLEPLVDEHVRQHDNDPAASLASISSVIDADVDWQRVVDADIAASLAARRQTRNAQQLDATSATNQGGTTSSADRFRVLRPHARGGIGEVFVAFDQELNREVALKEIQSRHRSHGSLRERFLREAEITGGLEHPGIVPVYSLGHYGDGRPFYAMRFIRGDSLKEAIDQFHSPRRTGVPPVIEAAPPTASPDASPADLPTIIEPKTSPPETQATSSADDVPLVSREAFASVEFRKLLGRFIDVCQAIEYAHSRGVLHRDLKPGNIMLGKYGETLVVDWGLAKAAGKDDRFADSEEAAFVPSSGSGIEQTQQGSVVGTPGYMSPEQAAGKLDQLGPTTDVYSLGATLYHLLTGQAPITSKPRRSSTANSPAMPRPAMAELLKRVQQGEFPRPREIGPNVPKPLEAICLKAMSLRPEDRYASSSALADDIEHWLADDPVTVHRETALATAARWVRKHRAWAMSGAAALAVVAVVSSIAAVWINSARAKVVTAQQAEANQLQIALRNEKLALASAKKAQIEKDRADAKADEARRYLYSDRMNLAQRHWENKQVGSVLDLLEKSRPQPDETDLRSFEWYYWDRLCHPTKVWDATSGQESLKWKAHPDSTVRCVAFSADGKRLASADDLDFSVKVWDATSGQETLSMKGHSHVVMSVAFSADGMRLASGSSDQTVKLWDTTSGQATLTLKGHSGAVYSVAFSPDGKRLASASSDQTVKVWDATSGQESLALKGHTRWVSSVAFSPDGKRLASASLDQTVKLWDAANGQATLTLKGHSGAVYSVAFSADGKRLASASADQTVKVWDATSGHETLTLKGHIGRVWSVAFSTDGKRLASASYDGTVKLWDAVNGQETLTLKVDIGGAESNLESYGETLIMKGDRSMAFSPDGKRLASASWEIFVTVFDARPWTPELRAEREALSLIHFLRDQGQPQSAWLAAITANQSISEPVRQRALQFARDWE